MAAKQLSKAAIFKPVVRGAASGFITILVTAIIARQLLDDNALNDDCQSRLASLMEALFLAQTCQSLRFAAADFAVNGVTFFGAFQGAAKDEHVFIAVHAIPFVAQFVEKLVLFADFLVEFRQ